MTMRGVETRATDSPVLAIARRRDGDEQPRVAVVIPSWNTLEYIDRCIESVRAETGVDVELLVVDNGSVDRSVEFLSRAGVAHIDLSENVGFARAVNLAVAQTRAPLLLVLNADVVLESGCLRTLVASTEEDPTLGGVQPKIIELDDDPTSARIYSAGQGLTTAASSVEVGKGEPDGPTYSDAREIFGVCGAICLLRRELFTELGGYDERYFAFYEDIDLNARARLAGWRFYYVPDAVALHVGHGAWRTQPNARAFNVRLTTRNRALTAIKVLPTRSLPWVVLATVRTLLASPFKRAGRAAIRGTIEVFPWVPALLRERRRLRAMGGVGLDPWLIERRVDRFGRRP